MQNLSQKQDYLSQQILDQGYDPEQFQQFMMTHSEKQLDLNLWKLQQIKDIVKVFKEHKKKQSISAKAKKLKSNQSQQQNNKQPVINQQQNSEFKNDKLINNKQQEVTEKQQQQNKQKFEDAMKQSQMINSSSVNSSLYKHFTIKSKKIMPELYMIVHAQQKAIDISIDSYTKQTPNNIFKSQYIQYVIKTSAANEKWQVKRRFTDFIWIQQYLKQKYQGLPIPPIPQKTTLRSFNQKHVDYRMMMLQRFLKACVLVPEICSDPVLQLFLRANQQYFRQSKKNMQMKLQQNLNSREIQSILGQNLILMDQHGIQPHVTNFYKQYLTKLTGISSQLNVLLEDIKKVQLGLSLVSSSLQQLTSLAQPTIKFSQITSVLYEYTLNMSNHMAQTTIFLKHNFYQLWNYETMYVNNLYNNLIRMQKEQGLLADKHKNSFLKISQQGVNKYQNSLQPNKMVKQFQINKETYRVKLSQIIHQMRRYEKQGMKQVTKVWINGLRSYIKDQIGDWMILCTDTLMKSMAVLQNRKLVQVQYIKK